MMAYANPENIANERQRADGYGLIRFRKATGDVVFECWPRFADASQGDQAQFPGWPITVKAADNDGRRPTGWLPTIETPQMPNPVVAVVDEVSGEVVAISRKRGTVVANPTFAEGSYIVKYGEHRAETVAVTARPTTDRPSTPIIVR
jgi:hypothetical protein